MSPRRLALLPLLVALALPAAPAGAAERSDVVLTGRAYSKYRMIVRGFLDWPSNRAGTMVIERRSLANGRLGPVREMKRCVVRRSDPCFASVPMRFDRIDAYVRARWLGSPDVLRAASPWHYRKRGVLVRVSAHEG